MLKSVDILIGFSVIMLVVSMSVTLIIQWIVHALGMRGKELLKGLTVLLQQLDPNLANHAEAIATKVLSDPMLARAGHKLAGVVEREELIKILLQIAANAAPQPAPAGGNAAPVPNPPAPPNAAAAPDDLSTEAKAALLRALTKLGIPDPGQKLDAIRISSMRLEASHPELATHVREAQAVITEAGSQFVARINGWFDPTMERVTQSFTNHSRYWTAGVSLVLALLLQIDAFKIVNRLAIDDTLRASLVGVGQQAEKAGPPADKKTETPSANPSGTPQDAASMEQAKKLEKLKKDTEDNLVQLKNLASDKLITWPTWPNFWQHWWDAWDQSTVSIFGVLLSAMLLSFGAPFWFSILGDLLKLRPAIASKEDQQRQDRESSQTPPDGGVASAGGESGDLSAG